MPDRMVRLEGSLEGLIRRFLSSRPDGASLPEIYLAIERQRPGTTTSAIRGTLNHGIRAGKFRRVGHAHYALPQSRRGSIAS